MSLINNRDNISQILSFDGLEVGKVYPTDIDFVLEFDNQFLILGEVKKGDKKMPIGQKLVHERIVDKWNESGGKAVSVKVSHDIEGSDVILKDCIVKEIYLDKSGWYAPHTQKTFNDFLSYITEKWNIKKLMKNLDSK